MSEGKSKSPRKAAKALSLPVTVPKWPFLLCDALFIGMAVWLGLQAKVPVEPWMVGCIFAAVAIGAVFAAAPFYWEYRVEAKAVEIAQLSSVAKEINKMETIAKQIAECTGNWTQAQEASGQCVATAKEIAGQISSDSKAFSSSMAELNNSRLKALELEVTKLKQAEKEWGSIVAGQLDLVYRLRASALLSGKEPFIGTMTSFQAQCRDLARRVGLTVFEVEEDAPFDPQLHQLADVDAQPGEGAKVASTKLPGFRLQGQLVRKAIVALKD